MGKKTKSQKTATTTTGKPEASVSVEAQQPQEKKKGEKKKKNVLTVSVSAEDVEKRHPVLSTLLRVVAFLGAACVIAWSCWKAYDLRLTPVRIYGRIIHEFDPWFNFRAAEYMAVNGVRRFFKWFDYRSWYPIGRPVGTTMFPGMQFLAVGLWRLGKWAARVLGRKALAVSLNDICVLIPAWCSVVSVACVGLVAAQASGSWLAAGAAAACMAVVPAHMMRTMAGVYDNESVAVPAMCLSFCLWCATLRTRRAWPLGVLAGAAYGYMAATWGGYIYAGNVIACHASVLVLRGHRTRELTRAYTLWWLVSTTLAYCVPTIGRLIYLSLENTAPIVVLVGLWVLRACDALSARRHHTPAQARRTKAAAVALCCAALAAVLASGVVSPFSIRVRSLFMKHTRTGNPLVDSVAEHNPGSWDRFVSLLGDLFQLTFAGIAVVFFSLVFAKPSSSSSDGNKDKEEEEEQDQEQHFGVVTARWFVLVYTAITMYFTTRMSRLLLLMGPVASVMAGIAIGHCASDPLHALVQWLCSFVDDDNEQKKEDEDDEEEGEKSKGKSKKSKKNKKNDDYDEVDDIGTSWRKLCKLLRRAYNSRVALCVRMLVYGVVLVALVQRAPAYVANSERQAVGLSSPHIRMMPRTRSGEPYIIRDYYDGYMWLRRNTPKDSRVLAWWDYGYQITGIARRISLADGNTWNLEHIATVGRMLALPERKGWELARLVADYVMVWAGNFGDDIGKSPHIARISNSVYHDICPNDPYCRSFSIDRYGNPSPSMAASMLYKMCYHGVRGNVRVNPKLFQEAYTSVNGLFRVFKILNVSQESKDWCADPKNRLCDHPGSWYCPGQYPPGLDRKSVV